jgi:hypothetical protein
MLTMMGLARTQPITKPCMQLTRPPNVIAISNPKNNPPLLAARIKIMAVAPTRALNENDMMLPLMVINVMPTATHPMKETVVNRDERVGLEKNPGVESAITDNPSAANTRTATMWLRCLVNSAATSLPVIWPPAAKTLDG